MGDAWKLGVTTVLAGLLLVGIASCGDDPGDSSSGSGSTSKSATPESGSGSSDDVGSSEDGGGGADSSFESDPSGSNSNPSSASGSASFRTPGGDNSIQDFGEEAEATELEQASTVLTAYMEARARDEWAKECKYLAEVAIAPLEQLASRSPQLKDKGCAALLAALASGIPASARASTLGDGIDSLRVEDDRAFALYHGTGGVDYFMQMVVEDGEWKVGALAPVEFP